MPMLLTVRIMGVGLALLTGQVAPAADDREHAHGHVPGRDYSGPVVFIAKRSIDLGTVREGEKVTATFVVENHGAQDLVIERVRATCGCTTIELSDAQRVVKPQESREIVAIFDSTRRIGKQRKPIILTFNDPKEPQVTLTLVAEVVSLFKVLPAPLLHLRSARRGVELPPLDVFPVDRGATFEKLTLDVPAGLLEYREEAITNDARGRGVRYVFKVPDHAELGPLGGRVTITAVIAGETAVMQVRVTGIVVGDLVARPALLQALNPAPRGHGFAPVTIAATNNRPFKVLAAGAGPFIDVTCEPKQQNKAYTVRARIRDDAPDGPLGTNIVIRTDNTGQPVLTIPLFANVRQRYRLEPAMALLGPQAGRTRQISLRADGRSPLTITGMSCDHPLIAFELEDADSGRVPNIRHLRVGIRAGQTPQEDFTADLVVQTNIPGAETVRIPVVYRTDG